MGWLDGILGGFYFDCDGFDRNGNPGKGILTGIGEISGIVPWVNIVGQLETVSTISGSFVSVQYIVAPVLNSVANISGTVWIYNVTQEQIWISKINTVDFTLDKTGESVRLMIPAWQGLIHQTLKLGSKVIIYGENGIASMMPSGLNWGVKNIFNIGLLGRNAVVGNDDIHYFIGKNKFLYRMTQSSIEFTDYSNQFENLSPNVVLSLDIYKNVVYIADGVLGFVYTPSGLGKGFANITGLGIINNYSSSLASRLATEAEELLMTESGDYLITEEVLWNGFTSSKELCVVAPDSVTYDPFEIWTDIHDFNSREDKTITEISFGTNVTEDLYGAIAYRWNKAQAFFVTPWVKVNFIGIASVIASGVEFKIGAKLKTYAPIRLDYITIQIKYSELKAIA
jgi:hypothetical protein